MNKAIASLAGTAGVTSLLFLCGPAKADTYHDDTKATPSTGFYLGGFGGYGWTDADVSGGPSLEVEGADWGVFAGYNMGAFLDRAFNVGIEAAIEGHFAWSDADDDSAGFNVEKEDEWGVSFRPGFSFLTDSWDTSVKPYGIFGYRQASFDVSGPGGSDEELDGFELGIGAELIAWSDYGIRLDYSHVFYESEGGLDPDEDDLRLGIAYHF